MSGLLTNTISCGIFNYNCAIFCISEVLSVSLSCNGDLLTYLLGLDIVRSAFGEEEVDLIIIFGDGGYKGRLGITVPAFFIPLESLAAICGESLGSRVIGTGNIFTRGSFFGLEILPIDVGHSALEGAA